MKEIWKEISRLGWKSDDMPNTTKAKILVSSDGRVKKTSYTKCNKKNKSYSNFNEHFYTTNTNRGKQRNDSVEKINKIGLYENINISGKSYSVHRLVAEAFIPNPDNKPQVNHINGIRSDNRLGNLEWVTNEENQAHAKESKNIKDARIDTRLSFSNDEIHLIISLYKSGMPITEIVNNIETKCSHETIRLLLIDNNIKIRKNSPSRKILEKITTRMNKTETGKIIFMDKAYNNLKEAIDAKTLSINNNFIDQPYILKKWKNMIQDIDSKKMYELEKSLKIRKIATSKDSLNTAIKLTNVNAILELNNLGYPNKLIAGKLNYKLSHVRSIIFEMGKNNSTHLTNIYNAITHKNQGIGQHNQFRFGRNMKAIIGNSKEIAISNKKKYLLSITSEYKYLRQLILETYNE